MVTINITIGGRTPDVYGAQPLAGTATRGVPAKNPMVPAERLHRVAQGTPAPAARPVRTPAPVAGCTGGVDQRVMAEWGENVGMQAATLLKGPGGGSKEAAPLGAASF